MAVTFNTNDPKQLLKLFDEAIEKGDEEGGITTWRKCSDGSYTHTSDQWKNKAYFKTEFENGRLIFCISFSHNREITQVLIYGYYHGHLIETFLNHFDNDFSKVEATALLSNHEGS